MSMITALKEGELQWLVVCTTDNVTSFTSIQHSMMNIRLS